jgi:hypothetical protein
MSDPIAMYEGKIGEFEVTYTTLRSIPLHKYFSIVVLGGRSWYSTSVPSLLTGSDVLIKEIQQAIGLLTPTSARLLPCAPIRLQTEESFDVR